ncbi:hypothetical protein F5J12DRAFT_783816 [Pisolithus orientalis]|uniref:uncharacterized protein n=1 Tax=Pisolithus orientalis TaxID=936130 RepID=UPI0022256619|nr:uncharacterized protein F5J12DRAFT_783816 [Pisolithus orientalis]KAI6002654.1 hypothetical protein F5J12DRAFT_783816 [Pisolithus orientalis]
MGHKSEKACSYTDYDSSDDVFIRLQYRSSSLIPLLQQTPALVDVDSDFFDLNAEVNHHAINRLLNQPFGADAEGSQTGRLTDLILSAADSGVGSTTKTGSEESDLRALLTVLSCDAHRHAGPGRSLMYRMLVDESQDAVADGDPYNFTHSCAYRLTPEEEAMTVVQKD